jgi:hypothetical protein
MFHFNAKELEKNKLNLIILELKLKNKKETRLSDDKWFLK